MVVRSGVVTSCEVSEKTAPESIAKQKAPLSTWLR